jgi:hypothetical protein
MSTPQEVQNTEVTARTQREERRLRREKLSEFEGYWRDHYVWLKQSGYLLRPRYSPEWVPSWRGTKKSWIDCEDGQIGDVRFHFSSLAGADFTIIQVAESCNRGNSCLGWSTGPDQEACHLL